MERGHLKSLFTAFEVANARWRRSLSLGASEFLVLFHLWMHEGSMSMGTLGRLVNLSSGGLTAVVGRLEAAGYARRESDPGDRRRILVQLTDTGGVMRRQFLALIERHEQAVGELPEADRAAIASYLSAVTASLEALDDGVSLGASLTP